MLVGPGNDRRHVVDAWVVVPRDLQPDPVTDRHPVPVAGRAPPVQSGCVHFRVQAVVLGVVLKDPVSHLFTGYFLCRDGPGDFVLD